MLSLFFVKTQHNYCV